MAGEEWKGETWRGKNGVEPRLPVEKLPRKNFPVSLSLFSGLKFVFPVSFRGLVLVLKLQFCRNRLPSVYSAIAYKSHMKIICDVTWYDKKFQSNYLLKSILIFFYFILNKLHEFVSSLKYSGAHFSINSKNSYLFYFSLWIFFTCSWWYRTSLVNTVIYLDLFFFFFLQYILFSKTFISDEFFN